jgi:hypothetical protein
MNSTQWTATSIDVFDDVAEGHISLFRSDDDDSLRNRSSRLQCAFEQCLTAEREQGLVGAHARAAASSQDEYGHAFHHSMILEGRYSRFAFRNSPE